MANTRYKKRRKGGDNLGNHLFETFKSTPRKQDQSNRCLKLIFNKAKENNEFLILQLKNNINEEYLLVDICVPINRGLVICLNLKTLEIVEVKLCNLNIWSATTNYRFGTERNIDIKIIYYFTSKNSNAVA
jgi:hypothetical protein